MCDGEMLGGKNPPFRKHQIQTTTKLTKMKNNWTIASAAILSAALLTTTSCDKAKEAAATAKEKAAEVAKENEGKVKEGMDKAKEGLDKAKDAIMSALGGKLGGLGDMAKGLGGATTLSALKEKAGGIATMLGALKVDNLPEPIAKVLEMAKGAVAKLVGAAGKVPAEAGDDLAALSSSADETTKAAATELEAAKTATTGALDGLLKAVGLAK